MAGFAAAKILEDILGAYFEDMDDCMLNIFEGHILLQNIEVRAGAIQNALGLPLEVKVGTIGRVELRIPWAKLNSEPTQLLLDDLFIICGPQSESVWVDDVEAERALDGLVAQGSAPCAHALRASACATAEGAGGASARSQRAHIAHLCARMWTGKRLPDHTLGPPHGARALVVHARARRVGRGGNERAHTARAMASRGRIGGGARCTPRGRGRLSRGRGRVTGARGSHNDKGAILGGFWDAWKTARKCDFFFLPNAFAEW